MANKNRGLGKGLGAIISTSPTPAETMEEAVTHHPGRKIMELPVKDIQANPDQPRQVFDEEEIKGLAASIQSVGLIQPVIVRKVDGEWHLVAGERRFRAVKMNGNDTIPAIAIDADEEKNLSLALIENIQRTNLDPMEEARAYRLLVDRFGLKQSDLAKRVGKERATVANSLRLLNLPEEIQEGLQQGLISTGHAKVILSLSTKKQQLTTYRECLEQDLSVRALERHVKGEPDPEKKSGKTSEKKKEAHIRKMEEKLVQQLGTKVEIRHSGTRGKIEISYYSLDDFDRIVGLIKDA